MSRIIDIINVTLVILFSALFGALLAYQDHRKQQREIESLKARISALEASAR